MSGQLRLPKNGYRHRMIGYIRVSTDDGWTGSHTLSTQEARIRQCLDGRFGAGQYDLTLFQDNGISGGYGPEPTGIEKRTRPTLKKIVEAIKTSEYDGLAVYDLSRFARSDRWMLQIYEDVLAPTNTTFISACENLDFDDPQGRVLVNFLSSMNKLQRDNTIKRSRDAALHTAELGYLLGCPGYGWRWEPLREVAPGARRKIIPIPEQGEVICHVKDRLLAGWNMSQTVRELNATGVLSPAGLPEWHLCVLRRIMKNPLHAGLVPSRAGDKKGQHWEHRYYDPEVRDRLLEAFKGHKRFPTNTSWADDLLLNGITRCARCGKRLYPTGKSMSVPTYGCIAGLSAAVLRCPDMRIQQDALDEAVLSSIQLMAEDPQMLSLLRSEAGVAIAKQDEALLDQQAALTAALNELEEQFETWADGYSRKTMTEEQFHSYNRKLVAQKAEAAQRLTAIESDLARQRHREEQIEKWVEKITCFPSKWPHLHRNEKKSYLDDIIESLLVDRSKTHTTVRVKLRLLPEQEIKIPPLKRPGHKKTTTGVAGLTPRQLVLLYWIDQGKTPYEAAEPMGILYNTVRVFTRQIRKLMKIYDLEECARLARGRIYAELSTLPLHGFQSPQVAAQEEGSVYLSPKLMQVLPLYASGATHGRIAELTGLPISTVKGRRHHILQRFRVKDMYDAVQKAKQMGLL